MGSFAALGALTGAAKGWNEGSKAQMEREQHRLDQEREERLEAIKHKRLMERDQAGFEQESKMLQEENKFTSSERQADERFTTSEREAGEKFEAGQNELDRASDLEVEQAKQKTDKKKSRKWETDTTQEKTTTDLYGNQITTPSRTTVTNPYDHKTYEQKGNIFTLVGEESRVRYPKEKARYEKILMDEPSPERISQFVDRFGYVPADVLAASERYLDERE